ncbi:hypothetical protein HRH25_21980 [Flavisolibacter sp. BT320]|nr:hypothetical protein [Flavisolibacter longurius]
MRYSTQYWLQLADRIVEPIFQSGLSKHHSIYLGTDSSGSKWISENLYRKDVRLVPAKAFFQHRKQFGLQPFIGSYPDRIPAVKRALYYLGKPYDLFSYNYEHYAEYVQHERVISRQINTVNEMIRAIAILTLIAGLLNIFTKR